MKRLQLFEFEDQPWLPRSFRNMLTQYLQSSLDFFKTYHVIIPRLEQILQNTGRSIIVDICSGGSGPWVSIAGQLSSLAKIILTDKFPNFQAWENVKNKSNGKIGYIKTPVDALTFPKELKGMRTIFTGFHHFKPDEAKNILEDAIKHGEPIAIFEFTERSMISILRGFWLYLILPLLITPFLTPRTFARFFWTYLIPVIPFLSWWDGIVSHLRTYTPRDYQNMIKSLKRQDYTWEMGTDTFKSRGFKIKIHYLIGYNLKEVQRNRLKETPSTLSGSFV